MKFLKPLYALISLLLLMSITLGSCDGGKSEVALANDSISMQDSFKKSNGELCKLKTTVLITYPKEYKDKGTTQNLQQLFNTVVLNSSETDGDTKKALNAFAKSIISQNSTGDVENGGAVNEEDFDQIDIDNFELNVKISNVYNDNDLLTFCREDVVKKNDQVTSVTHHYVTIDLLSMKKVTLSDLFLNENNGLITQMLKNTLMETEGVSNEDDLNQLGYYNLPNLTLTSNFYFDEKGITWCYAPGDIAVTSVGETKIMIPFEELMRFNNENSLLSRF